MKHDSGDGSSSNSNSPSSFLKQIISMVCSMTKSKSLAIRNKTNTLKARLVVMSLLKNKKISFGSISHKIQAVLGHHNHSGEDENDKSKAIVLYNAAAPSSSSHAAAEQEDGGDQYYYYNYGYEDEENDRKYPDLRHTLFDEDDDLDLGDPESSAIDLVKNSKEEEGEDFKLEDEIDQVADLFILKFHKRMRLQKLESFKRYQEMLQRST